MNEALKINTIIVEDDVRSQEYLLDFINTDLPNIEVIGCAESIKDAVSLIQRKDPELIYMDIELKDGYCFRIFEHFPKPNFEVIFVTAFDNLIQKAMDHYAFSYIIKPIDPQKLIDATHRYLKLKERLFNQHKLESFSNFLFNKDSRFLVQVGNEHISIAIKEIVKCEAQGNYTLFFLEDGKTHLASKSLKYYESLLTEKGFFKPHRSVIINIDFIKSIYKKETIILTTKEKIHVSVRNKPSLTRLINALS
ncbi:LytTR family DNA-binding domain-containing protein [Aureisphaera galaxeae]|uniref:LytR/AlgR family response regulator transcription factor n=1 Tax=Aureisphaera galaxeae TaxID=1538023 RepID=UPI00234FE37E|nr:LytTR family DNA-binding domain-containing protein [Aureisphaera galaxeae]MDC8002564.1 LytTR family DNA-binding domain-containing protein [Aureisphaera galaxeae]